MVPPIFIDMLIFEFVVGPRVSDGTGGSPPPPSNSPPGPLSKARLRYLVGWVQVAASASVVVVDLVCNGSHFPYPSEDTPVWLHWSREKVDTASATVSKRNVVIPDRPRSASSQKVATPDKSSV